MPYTGVNLTMQCQLGMDLARLDTCFQINFLSIVFGLHLKIAKLIVGCQGVVQLGVLILGSPC